MKAVMHTDGGARGNPGPAAIGVVIEFPDGEKPAKEIAETIGDATNNVAEYRAILRGLEEARAHGATDVECFLDSELVVKQLSGEYRVKDARLAALAERVHRAASQFTNVTYTAVPRAQNRKADRLLNTALDALQKRIAPYESV